VSIVRQIFCVFSLRIVHKNKRDAICAVVCSMLGSKHVSKKWVENVLCMRHQPEACASDFGDNQSRYLFDLVFQPTVMSSPQAVAFVRRPFGALSNLNPHRPGPYIH